MPTARASTEAPWLTPVAAAGLTFTMLCAVVANLSVGGGATALFGDLGVKGITKAHAIDRLLAHLGANRQDTVAFGDAAVDIPMLEYCAVGVAMGNGSEDIKAMAGIVAGDVEEDGLARAFERLGLM